MTPTLLDPHTKARRTDPDTSHEAASAAKEIAESHHRSIREYLEAIYPHSASYEDIGKYTGIDKTAIGRRMNEAVDDEDTGHIGYAVVTGRTILSTGRSGQTWRAK